MEIDGGLFPDTIQNERLDSSEYSVAKRVTAALGAAGAGISTNCHQRRPKIIQNIIIYLIYASI